MKQQFELCKEHIKLLQNMSWDYQADYGEGGPGVDQKRPYGNSYVPPDVAEILGIDLPDDDGYDERVVDAMKFHHESHTALEIILQLKTFEPGLYKFSLVDYKRVWKKVK